MHSSVPFSQPHFLAYFFKAVENDERLDRWDLEFLRWTLNSHSTLARCDTIDLMQALTVYCYTYIFVLCPTLSPSLFRKKVSYPSPPALSYRKKWQGSRKGQKTKHVHNCFCENFQHGTEPRTFTWREYNPHNYYTILYPLLCCWKVKK